MTIRLYAELKKIPLEHVSVRLNHEKKIHAKDCEECETKVSKVDHIDRAITMEGPLDADAAQAADGDRRQVPGAPDAGIEDRIIATPCSAGRARQPEVCSGFAAYGRVAE